jgi:hypothetical protein
MNTPSPLQEAIDKAGNQEALADLLTKAAKSLKDSPIRRRRFKQQHVSWWLTKSGGVVPAEVAPLFPIAVGIAKERMRPDVFGVEA